MWRRNFESELLHLFRNKNDFSSMRRHSRQIRLGNWSCLVTFKWMGNAWKKLQLELLAYKKCVICSYFAEQNTSSPEQAMIRTFSDFSLVKKISTEFSSLHEHKHNLHMPCSISMLWFSSSISIFILSRSLENFSFKPNYVHRFNDLQ